MCRYRPDASRKSGSREFGLREGRRALVLCQLDPRAAADRLVANVRLADAAHVETQTVSVTFGNPPSRGFWSAVRRHLYPAAISCDVATMLFMVIERFRDNDMVPIYRRVREEGRLMPDGLKLMECDDLTLFQEWLLRGRGLGVTFEIVPS